MPSLQLRFPERSALWVLGFLTCAFPALWRQRCRVRRERQWFVDADRLQRGMDLRDSAASRSGAQISASARRSLLKAAFEFARYCNGFDCGCRFPNPRANPFPCFWMAAVQLFPSLQGLLDAVFDAQFLPWRKRGDIGRNWTNTRLL